MVTLTEETPPKGFERLVLARDEAAGLTALICIHSTACGPAAGGCRMWDYPDLDAARHDVLRLAKGMTAKNALAGLGLGGGKSVILGDARRDKSPELLRAFGQAVDHLSGHYYTAEDVGISTDDMAIVAQETAFAVGLDSGPYASGDPSPFTAGGVFQCLRVGAVETFGSDDLTGRRVLVQGLGHVGMRLAASLHEAGAQLLVSDVVPDALDHAVRQFNAQVVPPDQIFAADMDIFAPCALGGVLTHDTAGALTARLICGAANNQLASDDVAETLRDRGIRYLPDYVVNAGGIVSVAGEIHRAGPGYRTGRLAHIADRAREILRLSRETGETTTAIAARLVDDVLAKETAA